MKILVCNCFACRRGRKSSSAQSRIRTLRGGLKRRVNQSLQTGAYDRVDREKAVWLGYTD